MVHKISLEGRNSNKRKNCNNRASIMPTTIIMFFGRVRPYKKSNPIQMGFIEDLILMIANSYMPLSIVESPLVEGNGVASLWSSPVSFLFVSTFLLYCKKLWKFI